MLFCCRDRYRPDVLSVAEPVTQYMQPPEGAGQTIEAARQAMVWTLFHYGLTGWSMYALMGMALGYFSYRYNLPLTIRSALYPIFGKRINGPIGSLSGYCSGDRHYLRYCHYARYRCGAA
ncbi:BCCT family transporter [Escherichia coli]